MKLVYVRPLGLAARGATLFKFSFTGRSTFSVYWWTTIERKDGNTDSIRKLNFLNSNSNF
jgi:hypothetical protein